ncbi:type I restriction enzyme, S subunit [Bradyrhizobium sp. Rc2d]|uniref:restriction endonuclease subunit S n=1 Tax=Bradyrhizobium sp. Rc2d TaxID=1855321 RepID=UPI000884526A|nr:restriction endonuclease subunit S [Bradyrhizobium sp. Rc2d]SDI40968.1 type I restriction enzyme, S subunit [Bradyrhizobium sp. Rc2d]
MNAERLLMHYAKIADATEATGRLRRFILDLAVRGKLVPQDSRDEPSSELLKLVAKQNLDHADLPYGWRLAKIGSILEFQYGKGLKASERLDEGPVPVYGSNGIVGFTEEPLTVRPSIIVGRKGSAGALNLCDGPSWTTDVAYFVEAPSFFNLQFLLNALTALDLDKLGKGVKPGLSRSEAYDQIIAIPPLAEQHRIVAKLDELMGLCDRLEAARGSREAVRDRLTAASLARLQAPDPDTFQTDARFALNALPALAARPDQIKALRQTILNLAVRGKLVPQDPKDEPASELLKRIAAGKEEKKRKTGDARIKMEPDPVPDELTMPLPCGWAVQSFENLFLFIDYRGNTPPKTDGGIPLITAKNIRMGYLNREPREYISKATFKLWMTRGFPEIGDLFFTTEAPLANICLNDIEEPFALAQRAICFQPYAKIDTKFLMFALMSDVMQLLIDKHATGMTAKGIKAANLKPLPIPIPPLAEQRRIVEKVEALMALCDRLEANLVATASLRRRLLEALLAEALAPAEDRELEAAE